MLLVTRRPCDPPQLMPYLVMDILRSYPGVPGLFVAAAYSGSLRCSPNKVPRQDESIGLSYIYIQDI